MEKGGSETIIVIGDGPQKTIIQKLQEKYNKKIRKIHNPVRDHSTNKMSESYHYDLRSSPIFVSMSGRGFHPGDEQTHILLTQHILKGTKTYTLTLLTYMQKSDENSR